MDAGGGTRGDSGAEDTLGSGDLNFDGRVAARVEDLTSVDLGDGCHDWKREEKE